ncbi:MAG: ABC transporter ATP-binding protein [Chlamydiales bacterium]|nr:ABC transporter ATP-binding protein [Chlamydiales bacterium]
MTAQIILKAEALSKTFNTPTPLQVLRNLSLEVREGERVAIMGKSGEGKSTLLHILGSLESATSGRIQLCEKDYNSEDLASLRCNKIGFIFQSFNLLEEYTTLENVLMPAKIARRAVSKESEAYRSALSLLDWVGLSDRADFPAKLLSGGEKQRAAIARALINDPALLLADEPSGNLDSSTSKTIYDLLLTCTQKKGKALIVVTHDSALAALCDRTLILKDGVLSVPPPRISFIPNSVLNLECDKVGARSLNQQSGAEAAQLE